MLTQYVDALGDIIDMEAISKSGIHMGVDPLGGSGLYYWDRIADKYKLNLKVVNYAVDPTFSFMCIDRDGKIRMDCSSPYAMAGLIKLKMTLILLGVMILTMTDTVLYAIQV